LPASLTLSGSDDGIRWTELDAQPNPDFGERVPRREFTLANAAKWNRYRLAVTAKDAKAGVRLATVELNEAIDCRPKTAVSGLAVEHKELTVPTHGRATLNATLAPLNSFEREVNWVSSDPTVAEVRKIGEQVAVVVGKKPGICTVTASVDRVTHTCIVTVTPSTLPVGWQYHELNAPAIPGSVDASGSTFALTGCGHAMTSCGNVSAIRACSPVGHAGRFRDVRPAGQSVEERRRAECLSRGQPPADRLGIDDPRIPGREGQPLFPGASRSDGQSRLPLA
jgi:hypothetical protein